MFSDKIEPIIYNRVETVYEKYNIAKNIVTVSWYCPGYE